MHHRFTIYNISLRERVAKFYETALYIVTAVKMEFNIIWKYLEMKSDIAEYPKSNLG